MESWKKILYINWCIIFVGLVFAVTGLTTLMFAPYWGRAGDRKGHETILSRSLIFAGLAFFPD